uniref:Uncharacterized protein n=1 Tax=Sphaerodactylus townsendi TaxID=933632 RepID=A0ACB8E729_9SAUR
MSRSPVIHRHLHSTSMGNVLGDLPREPMVHACSVSASTVALLVTSLSRDICPNLNATFELWNTFLGVPEIINTIRQAGKIARQEEFQNNLSDVEDPFSKKFEVLFCGRVTVAHKNAPPALIDECIEKFNDVSCTKTLDSSSFSQQHETANHSGGFSIGDKFRSVFQPLVNEEQEKRPMRKSYSQPGLRSLSFKKDLQSRGLRSHSFARSFDEEGVSLNLSSQFIHGQNVVQPTDIAGNRIMLFTVKHCVC